MKATKAGKKVNESNGIAHEIESLDL
jgi:hypothetical protein